jgi:hypothetical protein
MNRTMN